ncbi:plasmid pRiA4b ORF-3 family protein [Myxococcaceae bacterium GXIMD 01537]
MASRKKSASAPSIHALHVELVDIQPPIWRELHVRSDMPLAKLHDVLQVAFGWTNSHMHLFEDASGRQYGHKAPGDADDFSFGGPPLLDEREYTVADVAPRARGVFGYVYDFGDDWVHRIRVKKVQAPEPGKKYPACVAGKRAAPPDDCGGVPGYEDLLEILRDPTHEEHAEMLEWVGGAFDPEAFELEATDKAVRALR